MKNYRLPIIIEHDKDGYVAFAPHLQGCYAQGETYEEAFRNIQDAIRLHLEDRIEDGEFIAETDSVSLSSIEVAV